MDISNPPSPSPSTHALSPSPSSSAAKSVEPAAIDVSSHEFNTDSEDGNVSELENVDGLDLYAEKDLSRLEQGPEWMPSIDTSSG